MARPIWRVLVLVVVVAASVLTAVAPSSARSSLLRPSPRVRAPLHPSPLEYVAMGDSSAAGPLVPDLDPDLACVRSTTNYPNVAADLLGAELVDVTCSGAELSDLSGWRFGLLPPQLDALSPGTDLVTLSLGGNDVGLFGAALSCLNVLPEPAGSSCADRFTAGGRDRLAEAVETTRGDFRAALDGIGRRAPAAELLVTGYGTYFRPGGCHPREPVWGRDADYVQASVDALSAMIEEETASYGGTYVDLAALSEGHDVCARPREKFYEGLVPSSAAAPLHPNAAGMAAFGAAVAEASQAPEVAPSRSWTNPIISGSARRPPWRRRPERCWSGTWR